MTTELALPVVTDAAIGAVAATPELDSVRIEHRMFGEQGPTDPVCSATGSDFAGGPSGLRASSTGLSSGGGGAFHESGGEDHGLAAV